MNTRSKYLNDLDTKQLGITTGGEFNEKNKKGLHAICIHHSLTIVRSYIFLQSPDQNQDRDAILVWPKMAIGL